MLASVAMRTSSTSRRRSSPFSSIQSNAYRKTLASWHRWRIRSKLGTPRSRRKPHPPAGRRSARGQRMPGATHVPLTVAQSHAAEFFTSAGLSVTIVHLNTLAPRRLNRPGKKVGERDCRGEGLPPACPGREPLLLSPFSSRGATTISDIEGKLDVLRVERTTARARAAITSIS